MPCHITAWEFFCLVEEESESVFYDDFSGKAFFGVESVVWYDFVCSLAVFVVRREHMYVLLFFPVELGYPLRKLMEMRHVHGIAAYIRQIFDKRFRQKHAFKRACA